MKKLSTEQKAKAYDEALERARIWKDKSGMPKDRQGILDDIFPELAESEDEKIRKALINGFNKLDKSAVWYNGITNAQILDWLEKQDEHPSDIDNKFIKMHETKPKDISEFLDRLTTVEQEFLWEHIAKIRELDKEEQIPTDNVELKFHEGDWIANNEGNVYKIYREFPNEYLFIDPIGVEIVINKGLRGIYHKWTIKDAKDGDILTDGDMFVIFKSNNYDPNTQYGCMFVYCSIMKNNSGWHEFWYESGGHNPTNYLPATKEQRDLLFQKMKEADYEWDAKKKELKKIKHNSIDNYCRERCKGYQETGSCFADGECKAKRDAKQKPTDEEMKTLLQTEYEKGRADAIAEMQKSAWSEEDEDVLEDVEEAIINYWHGQSQEDLLDWLKSLKDRVQPQPKREWSEWDEKIWNKAEQRFPESLNMQSGYVTGYKDAFKHFSLKKEWSKDDMKLIKE